MIRRLVLLSAPLALVTLPIALAAQSWRTFDVSRQVRSSDPLSVHVAYGAGRITIEPTTGRSLFDMHLRYDIDRSEPRYTFDAATRELEVGIRHHAKFRGKDYKGSELRLGLSRDVPLRLDFDIGAAETDIDLGGLQVRELTLKTGATDTRLRFSAPNPERLSTIRVDAGAASIKLIGLGNANAERLDVNVGVGSAEIDLSGEWRGDLDMSVSAALGSVNIIVPGSVAIRVERSGFLQSFDAPGLEKRDGYWVSDNWDSARYRLRIRSSGALGSMDLRRSGR